MSGSPDMRHGGGAPVPWPVSEAKSRLSVPTEVFDKLVERAPIETVRLDKLVATQPTVDPQEVARFTKSMPNVPKGKRNARGMLIDMPTVFRRDGEDRIFDGHHRLAAEMRRGQTEAKVRYVDLDAFRSSDVARWASSR